MRNKSFVEAAEELRQAWREFLLALGFGRLADWLSAKLTKLTKEDGK